LLSIAHQDILNKKIHVKKLQENVQEDINLLEKKCEKFRKSRCSKSCPRVVCTRGFYKKHFKHICCPRCVRCKCPREFDPVCATNNVTFRNACDAKCQGFVVKHLGSCTQPCKGVCPKFVKPVCGRDGKTYRNKCVLRNNLIEFKYDGHCGVRKVADPKDNKHNEKKKKVQNKKIVTKYHKFLANKHRKECVKVVGVLINRYKKATRKLAGTHMKNNKKVEKLRKIVEKRRLQVVKITQDCQKYHKITKENKKNC